jgi:hypothetical protein
MRNNITLSHEEMLCNLLMIHRYLRDVMNTVIGFHTVLLGFHTLLLYRTLRVYRGIGSLSVLGDDCDNRLITGLPTLDQILCTSISYLVIRCEFFD